MMSTNWLSPTDDSDVDLPNRGQMSQPGFSFRFLGRRWPYILFPFVTISLIGIGVAAILPATYLSEGKLLVQPQQVSTELVRATVTSTSQDRLQVIEQRTTSRDNLMEIADKYQLFPGLRKIATPNELVDRIKKDIKIAIVDPTDFNLRSKPANPPVVFTLGFQYSDPIIAEQIASELIHRMLNEDVRDRSERALSTTKFMTEEFQKVQAESSAIDAKVSQLRASLRKADVPVDDSDSNLLAQLRQEYAQKSALYSEQHPVLKSLRLQIQSLERRKLRTESNDSEGLADLNALVAKQEAQRKTLDLAASKLAAAQAGENLEKNRQSEQLEVLELPSVPQRPISPNRLKIALGSVIGALGLGIALAYIVDSLDKGISSIADLAGIVDRQLVSTVPFISTRAEIRRKNGVLFTVAVVLLSMMAITFFAVKPFVPDFTEFATKIRTGVLQ